MTEMNINPVVNSDLDTILVMAKRLHDQHNWTGEFNNNWKKEFFKRILNNKKFSLIKAVKGNKIIGYAFSELQLISAISKSKCHIREIYIDDDYMHCGFGSQLLNNIISWGKSNNVLGFSADVAIENKYNADKFFIHHGFKPRSVHYYLDTPK